MHRQLWIAYQVVKRNGNTYFSRIGTALSNPDHSLNVTLEAMPINGEFHLRRYEEGKALNDEHKKHKLCGECHHTHHISTTAVRDMGHCTEFGCECKEFKDG